MKKDKFWRSNYYLVLMLVISGTESSGLDPLATSTSFICGRLTSIVWAKVKKATLGESS